MIKTYDEALKTLNDIRTYLVIGKADDCVQELDKVAKYFINEKHKENPSFSDCIKEWKEKGFNVREENNYIYITPKDKVRNEKIMIRLLFKDVYPNAFLTSKQLELLSKTLKSLEVENDK